MSRRLGKLVPSPSAAIGRASRTQQASSHEAPATARRLRKDFPRDERLADDWLASVLCVPAGQRHVLRIAPSAKAAASIQASTGGFIQAIPDPATAEDEQAGDFASHQGSSPFFPSAGGAGSFANRRVCRPCQA